MNYSVNLLYFYFIWNIYVNLYYMIILITFLVVFKILVVFPFFIMMEFTLISMN